MSNFNLSELVSGGIAQTFGSMNELQNAAAQMEMKGLAFYSEMLPFLATFNEGAKEFSEQQAKDQITEGWVQFGMGMTQAAVTAGTAIGGMFASNDAINEGENEISTKFPAETEITGAASETNKLIDAENLFINAQDVSDIAGDEAPFGKTSSDPSNPLSEPLKPIPYEEVIESKVVESKTFDREFLDELVSNYKPISNTIPPEFNPSTAAWFDTLFDAPTVAHSNIPAVVVLPQEGTSAVATAKMSDEEEMLVLKAGKNLNEGMDEGKVSVQGQKEAKEQDEDKKQDEIKKQAADKQQTTAEEQAVTQKQVLKKQAADKKQIEKIREQAAAKGQSRMSTANMIATGLQGAVQGSFSAASGYVNAKITQDQAYARFAENASQTITQNLSTISAFIQGQEGKEQAAAQAMLAMIQVSTPA